MIGDALNDYFQLEVAVFIRTRNELQKIVANNPFANEDPNHLFVSFLSKAPVNQSFPAIDQAKAPYEKYLISGSEIYLYYPLGVAKTKLSHNLLEKTLGLSATTRNWNTVMAVFELSTRGKSEKPA
jgi:uncharacterized protein (DUF1697 family)